VDAAMAEQMEHARRRLDEFVPLEPAEHVRRFGGGQSTAPYPARNTAGFNAPPAPVAPRGVTRPREDEDEASERNVHSRKA
jgi:hypothetical protein